MALKTRRQRTSDGGHGASRKTKQVRKQTKRKQVSALAAGAKMSSSKAAASRKPPASWKADYPLIEELRSHCDAPVDTVGCERLANPRAKKADYEWQCLVAAMLSAMTKDQMTAETMVKLQVYGNSISHIAATPVRKLDRLIAKVGFHATKAKNIRATAQLCLLQHGGRVPRTLEELLALPGVGPKMAHLTLHAAFGTQEGLCVDTHVHRIANALGWVTTRDPEQTRVALEAWLPHKHWADINVHLVGLGQLQQQEPHKLVERCLEGKASAAALQLLARIGLPLRRGKYPRLDKAAEKNPAIRKLLV
mmetsp:Transcript_144355/g.254486  ORF Transcript_144355/g.254486 Transcript_144355/m.254486 type:complete len:307 (+) Transcript_144355:83-1003(+)